MPAKRFLIHFPDRTKKQVSTAEKEQMLLAGELRKIDANRFEYVAPRRTQVFHSFQELAPLAVKLKAEPEHLRRFLAGLFIVELNDKRMTERLETAEGLQLRYPAMLEKLAQAASACGS